MLKYDVNDLETMSIEDLCVKYNSTPNAIRRIMSYYRISRKKVKVKINYQGTITVVHTIQECCETLNLSRTTIIKALKGERVPILENLGIKLEAIRNG